MSTSGDSQKSVSTNETPSKKRSNFTEKLEGKLIPVDGQYVPRKPVNQMTKKEKLLAQVKPPFILPENRCDKNQRRPSDSHYDPTSLHISPEDFKQLTDGMKRYWEIKKDNMDKVLLYRFGDWYVTYYEDTVVCAKIFDLTVTTYPGVPQVGFEIGALEKNIGKLTERGFKVAVCEQMETREMMDRRIKAQMEEKRVK